MNMITKLHHISMANRLHKIKEYDRMRDRFISSVGGKDIHTPFVLDYCQIDHLIYQICYGRSIYRENEIIYSICALNTHNNSLSINYFNNIDDVFINLPFDERRITKRYVNKTH